MKYAKLGNSELMVSRICMGCMGFGDAKNGQHSWTLDEEHSREIIRRGLELGVNFFDTAIGYQSGTSEQYLGRTLRDAARRDDVVVATIRACPTWEWIMWICTFIICGTIRRPFTTSWTD